MLTFIKFRDYICATSLYSATSYLFTKFNMKKLLFLLSVLSPFLAFNQSSWKQEYSSSKVFIENKGQFDASENKLIGEIQYAADFGSTRVFFGKKGVSYSFLNAKKVPRNEREHLSAKLKLKTTEDYKQWEKVIGKFHYQADEVNMVWENANYSNIKAEGQRSDYHSYSFKTKNGEESNVNYVKGFNKITYKNIYPKIDIEYAIHPQEGLKYAVILHPGANPDDVKMVYDRAVRIENGKVKVATLFGDIVDHEPFTFYQKNTNTIINSSFEQIGQTIKFKLGNYDNKKTVVIDPWTQTPAFPSNWDVIWEVEKDAAGNVYAIGGIKPMQLLKNDNERLLNEARAERDRLLKEASEMKDQILAKAKNDAKSEGDKMIVAAKYAIEREKLNAMNELKSQVAVLSIDMAEKILRKQLADRGQQEAFVNDNLNSISLN